VLYPSLKGSQSEDELEGCTRERNREILAALNPITRLLHQTSLKPAASWSFLVGEVNFLQGEASFLIHAAKYILIDVENGTGRFCIDSQQWNSPGSTEISTRVSDLQARFHSNTTQEMFTNVCATTCLLPRSGMEQQVRCYVTSIKDLIFCHLRVFHNSVPPSGSFFLFKVTP
jgi:hypothetical protein